jgi:uncharacterized protein
MRQSMPGVRIERTDSARAEPLVLRTDIAAFVGLAERGPLDTPVAVESWRQFQAHFGERIATAYLAYAVRGFFDNGGRRAWVVRVAARRFDGSGEVASSEGARAAWTILRDAAGRPCWRVAASSPGTWGNGLALRLERERPLTQKALAADPGGAGLASVAGISPGELVELVQAGGSVQRLLVLVDSAARRIHWVHPDPRLRTPDQLPWTGLDPALPLQVSRVAYGLSLWQRGVFLARWSDLHPAPSHPRFAGHLLGPTYPDHLALLRAPPPRDAQRQPPPPAPIHIEVLDEGAGLGLGLGQAPIPAPTAGPEPLGLSGGTDGLAALQVKDFLGRPWSPRESDLARLQAARGLQSLAAIEEIALIAIPDILIEPSPEPGLEPQVRPKADPCRTCPPPPQALTSLGPPPPGERPPRFSEPEIVQVQRALLADCEATGDRFAVLSPPLARATDRARGVRALTEWRALLTDLEPVRAGALYAPWIGVTQSDALPTPVAGSVAGVRVIPACGHVAGAIARTDLRLGVMRAPANIPLHGLVDLHSAVGDDGHGALNAAGIDVLRAEPGRTPAIQGARTLSDDPLWRYVNTVRMVQALRRAFETVLRFAVFEPNDGPTRAEVAATLIAVLTLFFERGAFAGATPAESFFVRCDSVSTDGAARERGELIALVGIAPAAPAEFVLLRVGRQDNLPRIGLAGEVSGDMAGVQVPLPLVEGVGA